MVFDANKMDEKNGKNASTNCSSISCWPIRQNFSQVVPENGLWICASKITSTFKCSYKCSLSNSNFNSKICL